jgi:hypothetical protein
MAASTHHTLTHTLSIIRHAHILVVPRILASAKAPSSFAITLSLCLRPRPPPLKRIRNLERNYTIALGLTLVTSVLYRKSGGAQALPRGGYASNLGVSVLCRTMLAAAYRPSSLLPKVETIIGWPWQFDSCWPGERTEQKSKPGLTPRLLYLLFLLVRWPFIALRDCQAFRSVRFDWLFSTYSVSASIGSGVFVDCTLSLSRIAQ